MNVGTIMTSALTTVASDASLAEAARLMRVAGVGVLPVVEGRELRGIITDRDIVVRAAAQGRDLAKTAVREAMTATATCCKDTDTVESAARAMAAAQVRRLPVKNADGALVGIVSLGDIALNTSHAITGDTFAAIAYRADS